MTRSGDSRRHTSRKDVEVLATLLVAYPQVSRATYDPDKKTLGMVFLCRGPLGKPKRDSLCELYLDSIDVYGLLIGQDKPTPTRRGREWTAFMRFWWSGTCRLSPQAN